MNLIVSKFISLIASIIAAKFTQKSLDKGYEKVTDKKAPQKSNDIESKGHFISILKWSMISGAVIGAIKVLVSQGVLKFDQKVSK